MISVTENFITFCDDMFIDENIATEATHNKFKKSKSICETIDNNAVYITKSKSSNGVIVFFTNRYACVISAKETVNNIPLFLLINEYNSPDEKDNPYEQWLHIIGKQIKKDENSKYFIQDKAIHFNNGRFDRDNKKELEKLVHEAKRLQKLL